MTEPFGIRPPGYRLPDETAVGLVRLQVSDLDRSLAFYGTVLGLHTIVRENGRAVLGSHGEQWPLVELEERPGAHAVPRGGLIGLYHFAILLPDRASLGRFVAHLESAGVRAGSADHAVSEAIYLWDPDGLGIEVYADRPRAAWHVEPGRELFMTTAPLDVKNLVEAGQGLAWSGMPAGTVVGHVHLHVKSLAAAEGFYHGALGFDKVVWSYPGALFMSAGGYHHHLGTNTWSSGPAADERFARLVSWDLVVPRQDDVAQAADSLRTAGHAVEHDHHAVIAADPWGTRLRLVASQEIPA
jgi:catechol 2,3-dioxygenase